MRYLAIVPARAGSKGIKNKNTRWLHGRPLVSWTLALADRMFPGCTVVTTDDHRVAALAEQFQSLDVAERPAPLASDEAPMLPVIQHVLERWGDRDAVVLLQPTQPFRRDEDVRAALDLFEATDADSVVSVVRIPEHFAPEWTFRVRMGMLVPTVKESERPTRRQDTEPAYVRDGSVYVVRRRIVEAGSMYGDRMVPLVIQPEYSCNLDTEEDWKRAERMRGPRNG